MLQGYKQKTIRQPQNFRYTLRTSQCLPFLIRNSNIKKKLTLSFVYIHLYYPLYVLRRRKTFMVTSHIKSSPNFKKFGAVFYQPESMSDVGSGTRIENSRLQLPGLLTIQIFRAYRAKINVDRYHVSIKLIRVCIYSNNPASSGPI